MLLRCISVLRPRMIHTGSGQQLEGGLSRFRSIELEPRRQPWPHHDVQWPANSIHFDIITITNIVSQNTNSVMGGWNCICVRGITINDVVLSGRPIQAISRNLHLRHAGRYFGLKMVASFRIA